MFIIKALLVCYLLQQGTITPTVDPSTATPTGLPYCITTSTPFPTSDFFDPITFNTPTPEPSSTPAPSQLTQTWEAHSTQVASNPTISPLTWRWVTAGGFTAYGSNSDVVRTFTISDVCYGGEVKGYHIQHTHIQNGQNAGYHYTLQGFPTKDFKNTSTNSLIRNQEFWVVQSSNVETIPGGIPNISLAGRPNINPDLHAPLTFTVEIGAGSPSYPYSYLQVNTLELLCSGGYNNPPPDGGGGTQPSVTPTIQCKPPEDYKGDPFTDFGILYIDKQCRTIVTGYYQDWSGLPAVIEDLIALVGVNLPIINIPTINICFNRYSMSLSLAGVDFAPFISGIVALALAGLIVNELKA